MRFVFALCVGMGLLTACGADDRPAADGGTGGDGSAGSGAGQGVEITNNLVTHRLWEREGGASATQSGNLTVDSLDLFVDGPAGDLHLAPGATAAIDQGAAVADDACSDDIDGEQRDPAPDIGADEFSAR